MRKIHTPHTDKLKAILEERYPTIVHMPFDVRNQVSHVFDISIMLDDTFALSRKSNVSDRLAERIYMRFFSTIAEVDAHFKRTDELAPRKSIEDLVSSNRRV